MAVTDEAQEGQVPESATPIEPEGGADPILEMRARRAEMLEGVIERREFTIDGLECRALEDGTVRMAGLASATETWYDVGDPERGGFRERISRNAFKRALNSTPDVVLLVNHEGLPLARTKNGSLSLREDAEGLRWQADLDGDDPDSRMLARKVEHGLLDQCSFAFRCDSDSWDDSYTERTIKSVTLHRGDVSVVTHGANPATSVTMRSADGSLELRAGAAISAARQAALQGVLDRLARADVELDAAQPELAEIMGVPNPDADDTAESEPDGDEPRASEAAPESRPVIVPNYAAREREALAKLRRTA